MSQSNYVQELSSQIASNDLQRSEWVNKKAMYNQKIMHYEAKVKEWNAALKNCKSGAKGSECRLNNQQGVNNNISERDKYKALALDAQRQIDNLDKTNNELAKSIEAYNQVNVNLSESGQTQESVMRKAQADAEIAQAESKQRRVIIVFIVALLVALILFFAIRKFKNLKK